jgi:hypothetical protein
VRARPIVRAPGPEPRQLELPLVLDLVTRCARIFNRSNRRDLETAQVAGLIEVLKDHYDPYATFDLGLRIAIVRALRLIGKAQA